MSRFLESLRSGRVLDFEDPRPEQIKAQDIAEALALENRFANQTDVQSSVMEHTMFCYCVAKHWGWNRPMLRAILLHDAAEAYMRDIPTRLKALLPGFRHIERRLQRVIFAKFGADAPLLDHPDLHRLDSLSGKLEAHHFFARRPAWAATIDGVEAALFKKFWPQGGSYAAMLDWAAAMEETSPEPAQSGNSASAA